MFNKCRKEITWGDRQLVIETGHVARQADGAVVITYGETTVLCTAVAARSARAGQDFFPLTVNYMEKTYAAGKIPGGFFKREGRPSEKETLTCRLIDRPIRPLFPKDFRNETQVITTVLSHDMENDPDIIALIGASAALTISGIPFFGPIAGARVGYTNGEYVLNPLEDALESGDLDLVVAGTGDAVLMVESEARELPEDVMLGAVMFAIPFTITDRPVEVKTSSLGAVSGMVPPLSALSFYLQEGEVIVLQREGGIAIEKGEENNG